MDEEGVFFIDIRWFFLFGIDVLLNGDVFVCVSV